MGHQIWVETLTVQNRAETHLNGETMLIKITEQNFSYFLGQLWQKSVQISVMVKFNEVPEQKTPPPPTLSSYNATLKDIFVFSPGKQVKLKLHV